MQLTSTFRNLCKSIDFYFTKLFRFKLLIGFLLFGLCIINPRVSIGQVFDINANVVNINGLTYIPGTGSGEGTVGAKYFIQDVVDIAGPNVDLILTIENRVNVSAGGTGFLLDAPGALPVELARFQPEINSSSGESFMDFKFEFFSDYTDLSSKLQVIDFFVTIVDLDGDASMQEFVEIADFSSFQVDATSELTISSGSRTGYTRIRGRTSNLAGIVFDNTASVKIAYEETIGEFNLRLGLTNTNAARRQFSISVGSETGGFSPGTFSTPVTRVNTITNDDSVFGLLKQPVTIDVLANDVAGTNPINPATVLIAGASGPGLPLVVPGEGTWSVNTTTGAITFTPVAALSGSPTPITYQVADTGSPAIYSTLSTVTVLYQETNPDFASTTVGVSVLGDVSTNDNVVAGTEYDNVTLLSGPAGGTLFLNDDGTFSFSSPNPGVYLYEYEVIAPGAVGPFPTQLLQITVSDPSISANLPVANPDIYAMLVSNTLNGNVLDNDIDLSGSPTALAVSALNGNPAIVGVGQSNYGGSGGALTLNADGSVSLVNPTVPGTYTFTYTIADGDSQTSTSTAFITVYPAGTVNVVTAGDDFNVAEQGTKIVGNFLTNDSQFDNSVSLRVIDPSDPLNTTTPFSLTDGNGNQLIINPATGAYNFIPPIDFLGGTSFTYTAIGTDGATATATAYFTVFPRLDANADIATAFVAESITGSVATNDVVLTGTEYTLIGGLTSELTSFNSSTGEYVFSSNTPGVFVYFIQVCALTTPPGCETTTLTVTVTDPALATNPPVANNDLAITEEGSAIIINVLANDQPGVPNTLAKALTPPPSSISAPSNGTAVLNGNNIEYTPNAGFTGTDSFSYQICDASTICATATVFIDVYPVGIGNLVLAADDYAVTNGITPVSGSVLSNDTQLSGVALTTVTNPGTYAIAGLGSLLLNADGTYTFTPIAGAEGTASFPYTVAGTDGATASATLHVSVYPPLTYTWTGGSTDWCEPTNWDRGAVPVAGANVTIPSTTNDPVFDFTTCPVCINDLTIGSGVTVGLTGKLCVTGDLDSQGNVVGAGSISLEGTTPQTITGQFNINNLELNNLTGGATITSGAGNMVNITESIKLTAGTLTTNDNLRLVSDASGDAYFAPISDAECLVVNIVGNVRVQKFVDGGNRAFRFIAHPFNNTLSLQQIRDYVHITGDGLDFNDTGNPSAFWYVTADGNQDEEEEDTGWVPVSSTNIGEWFKGRAVRMMFRGPRTQGGVVGDDNYSPLDVTYELIGSVNLCEQELTGLVRSGSPGNNDDEPGDGAAGSSAFNFIGNPYPAAIDLKTIPAGDRANVGPNYYVWQPRVGIQSGSTVFNTGSGRGGNYLAEPFEAGIAERGQLASGTGFFVFALVDGASLRFTEANKLAQKQLDAGAAVTFREDNEFTSRYGANSLQLAIDVNGEQIDRVLVYFDKDTKAKVDNMDATKFENPAVNFFTVSEDDYAMAIDRRPWVAEEEYRIPLHILSPAEKYTLTVPDFDLDAGRVLQLHDRHLDKLITLEKGTTYEFEVTADQATKGHRFDIVMGVEVITSIEKNADRFQAFLLPNPAQQQVMVSIQRPDEIADTHLRLVDIRGVKLYETILKATDDAQISYEVGSLAKGVYLVEITHGKQRIVKRLMVN